MQPAEATTAEPLPDAPAMHVRGAIIVNGSAGQDGVEAIAARS